VYAGDSDRNGEYSIGGESRSVGRGRSESGSRLFVGDGGACMLGDEGARLVTEIDQNEWIGRPTNESGDSLRRKDVGGCTGSGVASRLVCIVVKGVIGFDSGFR
jgi:hypothetical protein